MGAKPDRRLALQSAVMAATGYPSLRAACNAIGDLGVSYGSLKRALSVGIRPRSRHQTVEALRRLGVLRFAAPTVTAGNRHAPNGNASIDKRQEEGHA